MDARETGWAPWWLWLWGVSVLTLFAIGFTRLLPFVPWAVITGTVLGAMEALGLLGPNDRYPPLTEIVARYIPRTPAMGLLYGVTVALGARWLRLPHVAGLGFLFALVGFLNAHFDTTYERGTRTRERRKWRRIPVVQRFVRGVGGERARHGGRASGPG